MGRERNNGQLTIHYSQTVQPFTFTLARIDLQQLYEMKGLQIK